MLKAKVVEGKGERKFYEFHVRSTVEVFFPSILTVLTYFIHLDHTNLHTNKSVAFSNFFATSFTLYSIFCRRG